MKRIALTICLLLCSLATADLVLVLKGTPTITVSSASINTAGDELTVNFSDSVTETDATGWSVEFDNYAERTLTYSSGSGTSAIVFSIAANSTYTDEDCDNDAAPVGTVCTLDYDSETGSISGLGDVTDQAVTNNSTAHPDPDLPEQVDTSLPSGWDGTADATPADNTALQAVIDGWTSGTGGVIELTAGTDYGLVIFPSSFYGAAEDPIVFRSNEFDAVTGGDGNDGFPAYGETVKEADASLMATLSRAPTSSDHNVLRFEAENDHIRMIGVQFIADGTWADANYLKLIRVASNGIHFDRCIFTASDEIRVEECIQVIEGTAANFFVINSCFHNLYGSTAPDGATGVRLYDCVTGLVYENTFEIMGPGFFTGDNNAHVISDFTFSRNRVTRPSGWSTGHGLQKSSGGETKAGTRVLVEENYLECPFSDAWECLTFKADGSGGPKDTTHVTVRRNKIVGSGTGRGILVHVAGSSPGTGVGPNFDFAIYQNLVYGCDDRPLWFAPSSGLERVKVDHNTLLSNGTQSYNFVSSHGSEEGSYHIYTNNITGGYAASVSGSFVGTGAVAFNSAWGSLYEATHNIFYFSESINAYDNDASPAPLGTLTDNLFPGSLANVLFTDEPNDDYTLQAGSPGTEAASDGSNIGCDVATLNTILSGVEE